MRTRAILGWSFLTLVLLLVTPCAFPQDTWETRTNAGAKLALGMQFAAAEKELQSALKLAEALGPKDPRLPMSHLNLGRLYNGMGKPDRTGKHLRAAVDACERASGAESTDLLPYLDELGSFYYSWKSGLRTGPSTIAITTTHRIVQYSPISPARPLTTTTYVPAGGSSGRVDRLTHSKRAFTQALAIREKNLGSAHRETIETLFYLAMVHNELPGNSAMLVDYERIVTAYEGDSESDLKYLALILAQLESLHEKKSHALRIETLYRRALGLVERKHGPEHPQLAVVLHNLGLLYLQEEKYADSEPLIARSIAIFEKAGPPETRLRIPLLNLAKVYRATGRNEEAQKLEERAKTLAKP